jgi:hypothetical protein
MTMADGSKSFSEYLSQLRASRDKYEALMDDWDATDCLGTNTSGTCREAGLLSASMHDDLVGMKGIVSTLREDSDGKWDQYNAESGALANAGSGAQNADSLVAGVTAVRSDMLVLERRNRYRYAAWSLTAALALVVTIRLARRHG